VIGWRRAGGFDFSGREWPRDRVNTSRDAVS